MKATASDIGPILPRYIVAMMINLPYRLSMGVRSRVNPTVAVALTVSYIMSKAEALVTADKSREEIKAIEKDIVIIATAFLILFSESRLLNRETSLLPRIEDRAVASNTAIVVVFTPPAVPTDEPPINIRRRQIREEALVRSC